MPKIVDGAFSFPYHQIPNVTQERLELSLYGVLYELAVGVKAFTSA